MQILFPRGTFCTSFLFLKHSSYISLQPVTGCGTSDLLTLWSPCPISCKTLEKPTVWRLWWCAQWDQCPFCHSQLWASRSPMAGINRVRSPLTPGPTNQDHCASEVDLRVHRPQLMAATYLPLSHKVAWKSPQAPSSMGYPPVTSSLAPLWKLEHRSQSQITLSERGSKAVERPLANTSHWD